MVMTLADIFDNNNLLSNYEDNCIQNQEIYFNQHGDDDLIIEPKLTKPLQRNLMDDEAFPPQYKPFKKVKIDAHTFSQNYQPIFQESEQKCSNQKDQIQQSDIIDSDSISSPSINQENRSISHKQHAKQQQHQPVDQQISKKYRNKKQKTKKVQNQCFNCLEVKNNSFEWTRDQYINYVSFIEIFIEKNRNKQPIRGQMFNYLKTFQLKKDAETWINYMKYLSQKHVRKQLQRSLSRIKAQFNISSLQIDAEKYHINQKITQSNHSNANKLVLRMKDLQFDTLNCYISLKYKQKQDPIKPYKVRYVLQNKCLKEQNKQKITSSIQTLVIQASFSLAQKQIILMSSNPWIKANLNKSDRIFGDQTEIIEKEEKNYHFIIYMYLKIVVEFEDESKPDKKQGEKDLFPNNSEEPHEQIDKRYVHSLMALRQKIFEPKLSASKLKKNVCVQIAKLMFQETISEDFLLQIRKSYWYKVQKYHIKMIKIFKSLDNIIAYSSANKKKFHSLKASLDDWNFFMRYFILNAINPESIRKQNEQVALQIWNQFKQLYTIDPNLSLLKPHLLQKNEFFVQDRVDYKALSQGQAQKQDENRIEGNKKVQAISKPSKQQKISNQNKNHNQEKKQQGPKQKGLIIADFLFEQNIIESKNLYKFIPQDTNEAKNQRKQQPNKSEEWTPQQDKKLCSFIVLHHRKFFSDSKLPNGISHYISKIIKAKTVSQCLSHYLQILNQRTEQGRIQKPAKEVVNRLILKHKIDQQEIISGIQDQINFQAQQLYLDFTDEKIYLTKKCKTPMNLYIKEFLEKQAFSISFFQ